MIQRLDEMIDLEGTADWRRRKAEEYPNDERNTEAAELLERLSEDIKALEGSPLHRKLGSLCETEEGCFALSDAISDELRRIGFHSAWDSATELLTFIISDTEDRLERGHWG